MGRIPKRIGMVLAGVFLAVQFVPTGRLDGGHADGPPGGRESLVPRSGRPLPPPVAALLERCCFDCHSDQTRWPWYAHVAPFSWLVIHDVAEAREDLDFSSWEQLDAAQQARAAEACWEEVEQGEMPLWDYLTLHPEARTSRQDRVVLSSWARGAFDRGQEVPDETQQPAGQARDAAGLDRG